ncbi:MAG TPA: HEAT repeat domain-containing protein [Chloroflexia bacterium]|nr:HEAT repeat domain-containing protein [Chloroflexia bacterium]
MPENNGFGANEEAGQARFHPDFGTIFSNTTSKEMFDRLGQMLGIAPGAAAEDDRPSASPEELTPQIIQALLEYQARPGLLTESKLKKVLTSYLARVRKKELVDLSVKELLLKLGDRDWQVRLRAVSRLREIADPASLGPLTGMLNDPSAYVRLQAVNAVAVFRDVQIVPPLIALLEDPDLNTRLAARNALKSLGKGAVPALIETLQANNPEMRWTAANLLGDIRDARALPALERLAENDQEVAGVLGAVKDVAARAIRSINRHEVLETEAGATLEVAAGSESGAKESFNWEGLLKKWSLALLGSNDLQEEPASEAIETGWLGAPGASEAELVELETRLGVTLPPSYRAFLKVSNGWGQLTNFIYKLWSSREVDWFRVRNQDWIDAWSADPYPVPDEEYFVYGEEQNVVNVRTEYLASALEISDLGDSAIYLLNPEVVTPEGEWEAWFFANWLPGMRRYRSFWEMMLDEYQSFLKLQGLTK